ncbi:RDD family protein [Reyranella sp.]|uniref:RDD family protein n=1 Tax=Reyranella sp. TaxID=1929291 RepID=UPI003D10CB32
MPSVPNSGPAAAPPPPPVWDARPPAAGTPTGYGGFWIRVVAYIIDGILLSIAAGVIGVVTGGGMYGDLDHPNYSGSGVSIVVAWLYFALMESSERGATVGKMTVGLRVVTDQGQRLSFLNATGRYFAKFISALIMGIGFLMIAFTDRKRGLHDIMAGTLVVKVR